MPETLHECVCVLTTSSSLARSSNSSTEYEPSSQSQVIFRPVPLSPASGSCAVHSHVTSTPVYAGEAGVLVTSVISGGSLTSPWTSTVDSRYMYRTSSSFMKPSVRDTFRVYMPSVVYVWLTLTHVGSVVSPSRYLLTGSLESPKLKLTYSGAPSSSETLTEIVSGTSTYAVYQLSGSTLKKGFLSTTGSSLNHIHGRPCTTFRPLCSSHSPQLSK